MTRPFLFLLPMVSLSLLASPAKAETDFQQWLTVSARTGIGDVIAVQAESTARFGNSSDGLYEIENVLLLGYKLTDQVTAWAGYVHNPTYDSGDFLVREHRAREQLTVENFGKLGPASLSARLRFEQRWRENIDGTAWRARPYIKAAMPLGGKTAPVLNLTAEPFFNLTRTSFQSSSGLDRLRSAVSLTIPLSDEIRLEAGYLNQHRFVRDGEDRGDHALTASLALSF